MGVVLWIAIFVKGIHDLFAYVDYSFSWEFADNMLWYEPYQKFLPVKQTKLLQLWDELQIPHEESKQVFCSLMIISFNVDPNTMTVLYSAPHVRTDSTRTVRTPRTPYGLRSFSRNP